MHKIIFYLKVLYQYNLYKSKYLFLFFSLFFYLLLKFFRRKDYENYNNFFKNISKINNSVKLRKKKCIHINFFSWFDTQNTIFSFFIINLIGIENNNILYFKTKFLNFFVNSKKFSFGLPLNFYSKISFGELSSLLSDLTKKSYKDIFKYKYQDVECGKYAISSSIRLLRTPEINLKNKKHLYVVKFFLFKSILIADSAINYLDENEDIDCAIFNDKSYVGAGELFDQCIKRKISCIQFVASYKNNIILLKKFNEENKNEHPSSISQDIWEKFKLVELSQKQKNYLNKEIEIQYKNNTWYPSAGTMIGKNFSNNNDLINQLKLNERKKTAIIFPHIFWDGTFFFGKDLFDNYIDWYRETLKSAYKNKNLNWIIKSHPSNFIKNNRDKISNNTEEPELSIIKELFGKVPENFTFIGSSSKINTFQLFEILDYCFTIRGTVGIEAALRNKIVITAGTGRYDNRGFSYNFDSKEKYFEFIKNLHNFEHTKNDIVRNAEKFAYIAFMCKTFELKSANYFYNKDDKASLNLNIQFDQLDNTDFIHSIRDLSKWVDDKYSDYFFDPCNEWKLK